MRAIWYNIEVASKENTDISSGYVCVVWDKGSSVMDFDHQLYQKLMHYEMTAWPVKLIATHICSSPSLIFRMVKPILLALTDKRTRTRTNFHNLSGEGLLEALSSYGIMKDMLPVEMGGPIEVNMLEWIAQRRATELEEL